MSSRACFDPQEFLANLVHDLRQPLGVIETSAFYLDLLLHHPEGAVQEQFRMIELQVAKAARMLTEASAEIRRAQDQQPTLENRVLTNSATAGVT